MKKGFTMIELIFVIVIIGILAAVAIPKLSATRDDAKIAKAADEVAMAVSDIGAYYTAQGKFGTMSKMTNVKFITTQAGTIDAKDTNLSAGVWYSAGGKGCIKFTGSSSDGNLTVADVNSTANSTAICSGLQTAVAKLSGTHSFGGHTVNYGN